MIKSGVFVQRIIGPAATLFAGYLTLLGVGLVEYYEWVRKLPIPYQILVSLPFVGAVWWGVLQGVRIWKVGRFLIWAEGVHRDVVWSLAPRLTGDRIRGPYCPNHQQQLIYQEREAPTRPTGDSLLSPDRGRFVCPNSNGETFTLGGTESGPALLGDVREEVARFFRTLGFAVDPDRWE